MTTGVAGPSTPKPTRREERRRQTVQEIKDLAMAQIAADGPDAVSLSGIVREMSMSPAAVYRYFANRDALLADLVVDAYDELADTLVALEWGPGTAEEHLDVVLRATRSWALDHPNAYRLVFQTSIGSGQELAPERTIPAASRSMAVIVEALGAVAAGSGASAQAGSSEVTDTVRASVGAWADRSGLADVGVDVLALALLTWTRLHGIISLEIGGHLGSMGIGADVLYESEIATIRAQARSLTPGHRRR
ncbi:AcrR family transcriptional regulator [Curtobacterium flaccumfaciens]|uniref:AcrR family transcriptional regulator n=1 Tax=Curtobacterium salicis TaxID=1779862 RepID=A0ABX0TDM6_9MICO|nr:AcrR family transcriptional regulator [Curtobacterium sp. WW7]